MTQAILNQIMSPLQTLELSELQQLSQVIQNYLKDREQSIKQATFHQALVASGFVRQIKHPHFNSRTHQCLIPVQGEPISPTIIEER